MLSQLSKRCSSTRETRRLRIYTPRRSTRMKRGGMLPQEQHGRQLNSANLLNRRRIWKGGGTQQTDLDAPPTGGCLTCLAERGLIAVTSTERRHGFSEWHCFRSRDDSTLANRAVFGLPYPSLERKSLWDHAAQAERSTPSPASCAASVHSLSGPPARDQRRC